MVRNYRDANEYRETFAEWLDQYEWQVWFTGTFRPDMTVNSTEKCKILFNRYLKKVGGKRYESNLDYFMAVEWNKGKEFTHVHALLNGFRGMDLRQLWQTWFDPNGRAVVERYEKGLGANHYLTKYCLKELCDWDIKINEKNAMQTRMLKGV